MNNTERTTTAYIPKRKYWIDWAKTIGITLVIIFHMPVKGLPVIVTDLLFTVFLPFFIIISGFLYKPRNLKDELHHSFYRLIIPYFIYNVLLLIYFGLFSTPVPVNNYIHIFLGNQAMLPYAFVTMWFIVSLFLMRLILSLFSDSKYNPNLIYFFLVTVSILIITIATYYKFNLQNIDYFQLFPTFTLLPFFILGIYLKKSGTVLLKKNNLFFLLLLCALGIYPLILNGRVDIFDCVLGKNILLFYFVATSFSLLFLSIIKNYLNIYNGFIYTISIGTLLIIGFNILITGIITEKIFPVYNITSNLLCSSIALLFFWIAIKICDKYFPVLLGKYDLSNKLKSENNKKQKTCDKNLSPIIGTGKMFDGENDFTRNNIVP